MRLSYLCDCAGERTIGREYYVETAPIRKHIRDITGHNVPGCPWRAFTVPIVREVLAAVGFFESGNLATALPSPSHKLIEGISFWHQVYNRVQSKQMDNMRDIRAQNAKASQAEAETRRR